MSFEEWWKTKDYPARCKGNCKEAYEAGLHADVHTDNSAVIAELENKIADIKANCNLAIEGRDVKIMELENKNAELKEELQKWKDEWQEQLQKAIDEGWERTQQTIQLTKAKEIIRWFVGYEKGEGIITNYNIFLEQAEQFLKEIKK